ncbi:hypothetical protein VQL36_20480 [Chengkuizengella sp. SCS-71B]|uniref:hypothetical protein n=1 Tax=Chengkuizengella sp. SCS-71B TaxID=3115290 RepID=UPI0032C248AC
MTNRKREIDLLWTDISDVFLQIKNIDHITLLSSLIEVVKRHEEAINKLLNDEHRTQKVYFLEDVKMFFNFILKMDPKKYILGSTGDNFESIAINYINRFPKSDIEVWKRLSNFIKDLITFTSTEICPQCKSDHLRIYTDIKGLGIYKSCATCFSIKSNGNNVLRIDSLIPVDKILLKNEGYI